MKQKNSSLIKNLSSLNKVSIRRLKGADQFQICKTTIQLYPQLFRAIIKLNNFQTKTFRSLKT